MTYRPLLDYDTSFLPDTYWEPRLDFGDPTPEELGKLDNDGDVCYNEDVEKILEKENA